MFSGAKLDEVPVRAGFHACVELSTSRQIVPRDRLSLYSPYPSTCCSPSQRSSPGSFRRSSR